MMAKVRIPARVAQHVLTSDAVDKPASDPPAARLVTKLQACDPRKDGSRMVELDPDDMAILFEYAGALADSSRDDAGWEPDARADLNAARAVQRLEA